MVRLSTVYDKDINKKVFVARGDESYARTTNCELIISPYMIWTDEIRGMRISSATINLYRTFGPAQLTLYDGEIPIETWHIASATTTKEVTDIYLSYDVTHELWAKYEPLDHQCLPSKSKKVELYEPIPYELKMNFDMLTFDGQIDVGSSVSIYAQLAQNGSFPTGKQATIMVYVDGDYVKSVTSTGNSNFNISDISEGKHTVRLEITNTNDWYGTVAEFTVMVGYKLEWISYPAQFLNGSSNQIEIHVRNYNDELIATNYDPVSIFKKGSNEMLENLGYAAQTDGVAVITVENIPSTGEYYASYHGSKSETKIFALYNPDGLTLVPTSLMMGVGDTNVLSVTLNDGRDNVPVTFEINGNKTNVLSVSGKAEYNYVGSAVGNVSVKATVGEVSESLLIQDVIAYWGSDTNKSSNFDDLMSVEDGEVISYGNYLSFKDLARINGTSGASSGIIKFDETQFASEDKIVQFTIAKKPLNVTNISFSVGMRFTVPARTVHPTGGIPYYEDSYTADSFDIPASYLNTGTVVSVGGGKVVVDGQVFREYYITNKFNSSNTKAPELKFDTQNGGELYIKDIIYKRNR